MLSIRSQPLIDNTKKSISNSCSCDSYFITLYFLLVTILPLLAIITLSWSKGSTCRCSLLVNLWSMKLWVLLKSTRMITSCWLMRATSLIVLCPCDPFSTWIERMGVIGSFSVSTASSCSGLSWKTSTACTWVSPSDSKAASTTN